MKQALKLILSTLFGACIGFGAVMLCITFFTETTLSEFFGNMGNVQLSRLLLSCILSLVCLILAVFVQIILHEGGHLIFGLATGYRFVSFRVGSLTLIKEGGKFRFKRFSISGTGGQLDFAMGAYLSKGGKSFICMSSTVTGKDGTVKSRIVPTLTPGSICTDPRSCTHYIATEYGMVNLKGLSTWQRAEALIGIAHPDFREQLIADAEKMHIWRRSNK